MSDLKRKLFDEFDVPETPVSTHTHAVVKKSKSQDENERSKQLNYRQFLSSAFKIYEEETLIQIE